ncbi:hypothetical protein QUB61_36240 [Microcoleus sp. C2D2]
MAVALGRIVRFFIHNSRINDLKYRLFREQKSRYLASGPSPSGIFRNRQIPLVKPGPPHKYLY